MRIWDSGVDPESKQCAQDLLNRLLLSTESQMASDRTQLQNGLERMMHLESQNFAPDEFKPVTAMWNIVHSVRRTDSLADANASFRSHFDEQITSKSASATVSAKYGCVRGSGSFAIAKNRVERNENAFQSQHEVENFCDENSLESGQELRTFARGCNIVCRTGIDASLRGGFSIDVMQAGSGMTLQEIVIEMSSNCSFDHRSEFEVSTITGAQTIALTRNYFPVKAHSDYQCQFEIEPPTGGYNFGSVLLSLTPYDENFSIISAPLVHVDIGNLNLTPSIVVRTGNTHTISFPFGANQANADHYSSAGQLPPGTKYVRGQIKINAYAYANPNPPRPDVLRLRSFSLHEE